MGEPTKIDEWLAISFFAEHFAIASTYNKRYGTKKINSDEEADAKYIMKWHQELPEEEKIAIHNEAVEMFKDFYDEKGE